MFAFTISSGTSEHPNGQKIEFDKIEVNVPLDDALFGKPVVPAPTGGHATAAPRQSQHPH
jgi:hypothetical protein